MEIHGALNGTKCLIVILTNGAAAASSSSSSSSSKEHRHDSIPLLISSLLSENNPNNKRNLNSTNISNSSSSSLLKLLNPDQLMTATNNSLASPLLTSISLTSTPTPQIVDEFLFDDVDYTLDIVLPLIVGLVVAMILGWMLIRYKMSAHQRSNYNGSIYCCPEECYIFCARFFKCNLRSRRRSSGQRTAFRWPKLKKRSNPSTNSVSNPTASNIYSYGHPQVFVRNSSSNVELESLNPATTKQRTSSNSSAIVNAAAATGGTGGSISGGSSTAVQQQPISSSSNKRSSVKSQHSGSIGSYHQALVATSVINTSPPHATSQQQQNQQQQQAMRLQIPQIQVMQSQPSSPLRLFRSSISSAGGARRESAVQFPDLMTNSNLFHSFQSKH